MSHANLGPIGAASLYSQPVVCKEIRHLRTVQSYIFLVLNSRIIEFWIFTLK